MTTGPGPALDETAFGAWLDSLPETDEPALICPAPDVHRGLYIAREVTWRLPLETFRAELASPQCPWCGLTKYEGGPS